MRSIEEWTDGNHDALVARIMDRGSASKTPTEHAAMVEIDSLRYALKIVMGDGEHGQRMSWEDRCKIGRDAIAQKS
jgi:hypothetical protein